MPHITVNKANLYIEETGTGEETLFFSHAMMWRTRLYDDQVERFKDKYRCIAYDHRGQGESEIVKDGYDLDTLAGDAIDLIEKLKAAPCHLVGSSMGGMVAMRVGLRRPDFLKSLILLAANPDPETSADLRQYTILRYMVRLLGMRPVLGTLMEKTSGTTFRTDPTRANDLAEMKEYMLKNDRVGASRAMKGVFGRESIFDQITSIKTPTLILDGEEDELVSGKAERIHAQIAGSKLVKISSAGHSLAVEAPGAVNQAIEEFLADL